MNKHFDLSRVRLIPKECKLASRDFALTGSQFGNGTFKLPVVPANMLCSISDGLAYNLANSGYFYIMHRFKHDNIHFAEAMKNANAYISISVGIEPIYYQQLSAMKERSLVPNFITIDVAHGHSNRVINIAKYIRELFPDVFIICGNVCTVEGLKFLEPYCDAIKIDIGSGSACTTFDTTQFGSRGCNASMLVECAAATDKKIILDGGIKTIGECVAAYVLGADMIMVGGMFSAFIDSPGDEIIKDNIIYKEFFGSSSEFTKGHKKYVEGKKYLVPRKEKTLIEYLNEDVNYGFRSGISYGGGVELKDLRNVDWIVLDK